MNKSIIEKYKPENFNDFHFHGDITNLIEMYIDLNKMKLLIIGEHSTGKSTLINVLINKYFENISNKDINDNILYVNPLQEQGISYYRNEVKIFCQTYCTIKNKKKLIIMDDFDLIHEQSQQVFRSLIDKYENNVNFIVSTSNVYKIIDTIQSRLISIKIPNISFNILNKICHNITKKEKIDINKKSLELFIKICDNNIQLMLQYLEGFRLLNKKINNDIIYEICSHINHSKLDGYFDELRKKNIHNAIDILFKLWHEGYNVMDILDAIFSYVKLTPNISEQIKYELIKYLCKFITIFHEVHEDEIELAIFTNNIIHLFE
jgi:DNA polymerase III delta prime subunit